jgi:hypothetical protein
MQNKACREHDSSNSPAIADLVSSLTADEHRKLHRFTERRLQRLAAHATAGRLLANWSAADLIHTVISKFLLGERHPKKGRHLPYRHRQNTEVFLRALMGAVNSELSNLVNSSEAASPHLPVDDSEQEYATVELANPDELTSLLQRRDLHRELFRRLRLSATPSQTEIVHVWEACECAGDIASLEQFDRRRVHEVRQLARVIVQELAVEISPDAQGIEMLM